MAKAKAKTDIIELPKPNFKVMKLRIVGDSPYISHRWSDKAKKQLRDKHQQKAKAGREKRDPQAEYAETLYWLDKNGRLIPPNGDPAKHKYGFGIKSLAFKRSAVRAGKEALNMNMTFTRTAFHVLDDYVRINGKPRIREDVLPVSTGAADLRYRAEFVDWAVTLTIRYNANVLSPEQIINLFVYAGFGVGVGDGRPEKNGNSGMYHPE